MKQHQGSRLRGRTAATITILAVTTGAFTAVIPTTAAGASRAAPTVVCPSVADRLPAIPGSAQAEVTRNLQLLETQIAEANRRLAGSAGEGGPDFVRNAILGPLRDKRVATIERIAIAIGRTGQRPTGLESLATCTVSDTGAPDAAPANPSPSPGQGEEADHQEGPVPEDFVDIRTVQPNLNRPRRQANASTGTFSSRCGRNENRHFNSDNVIVAPGVTNGAHHVHDYVGNLSTSGASTNESLAAAGTTCTNGDKSTYYWPVLRRLGGSDFDANAPGGGQDGNVGTILRPVTVSLTFSGSPVTKVVPMPRFLRIITGDAKAFTNGTANANASWTCTGFENRRLKDKYPLCPPGSKVVRIFEFQSCWDGVGIDSTNHRTHVAFAQADGSCPAGFTAIPQLTERITYSVPPGPSFAVDSFHEQLHKPVTDHGDFINVMTDGQMRQAVDCINTGRRCG